MSESYDLIYSDQASATRYIYYKDKQPVNIFVEDKGKEYEYEAIFSILMPKLKHITVIASGGKQAMKECFAEFGTVDKDNLTHPNIYIADGDFDRIIFPEDMISDDNFIYLDAYNIENYLLDEDACVRFAVGKLQTLYKTAKERIDFNNWYTNIVTQAKKLFLIYCHLQANHPSIKNVGNGPYIFIDPCTGLEKDGAFDAYKQKLLCENNIDIDSEINQIEIIEEKYNSIYGEEYWHLICGKFLITSMMCHLKFKGISTIREYDLKWWLIDHISAQPLKYVVDKINTIISKALEYSQCAIE